MMMNIIFKSFKLLDFCISCSPAMKWTWMWISPKICQSVRRDKNNFTPRLGCAASDGGGARAAAAWRWAAAARRRPMSRGPGADQYARRCPLEKRCARRPRPPPRAQTAASAHSCLFAFCTSLAPSAFTQSANTHPCVVHTFASFSSLICLF